jgi:hypothetical protein
VAAKKIIFFTIFSLFSNIFQTEVCDETYTKNCQITFLEDISPIQVGVCYTEAKRVCDQGDFQKKRRSLRESQFEVASTCIDGVESGYMLH